MRLCSGAAWSHTLGEAGVLGHGRASVPICQGPRQPPRVPFVLAAPLPTPRAGSAFCLQAALLKPESLCKVRWKAGGSVPEGGVEIGHCTVTPPCTPLQQPASLHTLPGSTRVSPPRQEPPACTTCSVKPPCPRGPAPLLAPDRMQAGDPGSRGRGPGQTYAAWRDSPQFRELLATGTAVRPRPEESARFRAATWNICSRVASGGDQPVGL